MDWVSSIATGGGVAALDLVEHGAGIEADLVDAGRDGVGQDGGSAACRDIDGADRTVGGDGGHEGRLGRWLSSVKWHSILDAVVLHVLTCGWL